LSKVDGLGLAIRLQADPFQCSIIVSTALAPTYAPTAQTSVLEVAVMANRKVNVDGLKVNPVFQVEPFQCCTYATTVELLASVPYMPATHTSLVAMAATPVRSTLNELGFEAGIIVQLAPSQCSTSARSKKPVVALNVLPTAHTSLAETADVLTR
jgi:hypothetical protein